MKRTHRGCFLFALSTAWVGGCADVGEPHRSGGEKGQASQLGALDLATDRETIEIGRYINSLYTRADVQHAFRTTRGQDIDCVDAYAQPGMKAPAMRGRSIPTPPVHTPASTNITNPAIEPLYGGRDEDGHDRVCPGGTVPLVRTTVETIRNAGGLNAYLGRAKHGPSLASAIAPPDSHASKYAHVQGSQSPPPPNMHGASLTLSVYAPAVATSNDHSLSQMWVSSGTKHYWDPGGCTPSDCYQTLEAGWTVDQVLNGDSGPHLFTFTTWDGYIHGAYNTSIAYNYQTQTYDSMSPAFLVQPNAPYTPGQPLSYNSLGSAPTEITLEWYTDFGYNDWWLYVNGTPIGSYSFGLYTGTMADGANGWGINLVVGGEVRAGDLGTDPVDMGTGMPAEWGYPDAAYQRNVQYFGRSQGSGFTAPLTLSSSAWYDPYPNCYDYRTSGGQSGWGTYLFFGGTSNSSEWWAFRSGCTPNFL